MERLRKKLQSERGASILLALLMLLVCMMVAASILAAAASNAGKARSNRAEQQKYLVLSSAIQLVADEIQNAKYTGSYKVKTWDVTTTVTDTYGSTLSTGTQLYYHCVQEKSAPGSAADPKQYTCGDLTGQLPLTPELDHIFSQQFVGSDCTPLPDADMATASQTHNLTVTLSGLPEDTGPDVYRVFEVPAGSPAGTAAQVDVNVQVKLDHNTRHISLTAWLGDAAAPPADGRDTMIAELMSKITQEDPGPPAATELVSGELAVGYKNPDGRVACGKDGPGVSPSSSTDDSGITTEVTVTAGEITNPDVAGAPMQWELHWIKKGAA